MQRGGLLQSLGEYVEWVINPASPTSPNTNAIAELLNDGFERQLLEQFRSMHASKEWGTKLAVDTLKSILDKLFIRISYFQNVLKDLSSATYTDFNLELNKEALIRRFNILEILKQDFLKSWRERSLTINKGQINPVTWIDVQKIATDDFAKNSFVDALYTFSHSEMQKVVSLKEIIKVIHQHGKAGVDNSAGNELCKRICAEICRRITEEGVFEFDPDVKTIKRLFAELSPESHARLKTFISYNLNDKKVAFIKIYQALYDGQSGPKSKSFLEGKEHYDSKKMIQKILDHVALEPESRAAKAWELAKRYYKECTTDNVRMMDTIYKYSYQHSGLGIFKMSKVFGLTLFKADTVSNMVLTQALIDNGCRDEDSRIAKICRAIG